MKTTSFTIERVFTITVGVHKTPQAFGDALEKLGMKITDKAQDLLKIIPLSQEEHQILLADITVVELGLPDLSRYDVIRKTALGATALWNGQEYTIESSHAEDGPALREFYINQSKDDWIRVGMESVTLPIGNLALFRVVHGQDGILYLDTDDGGDDEDVFDDHVHFTWRLMKKQ